MALPCGTTILEVGLDARGGLVAVLGGLREELHNDLGDRDGNALRPFRRRRRFSSDMAVDPFQWIGRAERQLAGEHLIEHDAERKRSLRELNQAIYPSGLFRRHIGERAFEKLRGGGRLALSREARTNAKSCQPGLTGRYIDKNMRWLDVLVNESLRVIGQARPPRRDRQPQKFSNLHGRADEAVKWLAPRVLEHQYCLSGLTHEMERSSRPCIVQLLLQSIFVS